MISNINNLDIENVNLDIDIDIDTEIIQLIYKKGFICRRELTNYLIEKHKDENGKKGHRYTKPTIDRRLRGLKNLDEIVIIKPSEFEKYGIEETDKRVTYLALMRSSETKQHLDTVFKLLESEDSKTQKRVLNEIKSYNTLYFLDSTQLDILIKNLIDRDTEVIEQILKMLCHSIIEKEMRPKNETEFIHTLKLLLKKYPDNLNESSKLRSHIIWLLGHYNDETVINQLISDAKRLDDFSSVLYDYSYVYTAEIIERCKTDLFNLETELSEEGKYNAEMFIHEIRSKARRLLGITGDKNDKSLSYRPREKF